MQQCVLELERKQVIIPQGLKITNNKLFCFRGILGSIKGACSSLSTDSATAFMHL